MKNSNMHGMQHAIKTAHGIEVTQAEAFEIENRLVNLISLLDKIDRRLNGDELC
jgi:hypothetical protein